jgi:trigger factor
MKIELNELEPCVFSVSYQSDLNEVTATKAQVLEHFKNAPVPGNRKGKASMQAIQHHYRDQVNASLKNALTETAIHNTIFTKSLRALGPPKITSQTLLNGAFDCTFEMRTKPDFKLSDYKGMSVPNPHITDTVSSLSETMLQNLRVKYGARVPYSETDFVQDKDNVTLKYQGSVDGEIIQQLCAESETLVVGTSQVKEFDSGLFGMRVGETRDFDIVVAGSALPSIANKTVHFTVTLLSASKSMPAPLDDSLAQLLNIPTLDELRNQVNAEASKKLQQTTKTTINSAVSIALVEATEVPVPDWMSQSEASYLAHQSKMSWDDMSEPDRQQFMSLASRNVKLSLILDRIREEEPEAQLTDEEVGAIISKNIIEGSGKTPEQAFKEMSSTGYLQFLMNRIRDEFALDFVVNNAKLVE